MGPAATQQTGGILKFFHRDSPASMSIHEETTISTVAPMMGVFNNLVLFKQDEKQNRPEFIEPELVERWSWDEDHTRITFKLRQGVKWHDGKPFTAADVKCTWDMLLGKSQDKPRLNPRKAWYRKLEDVVPEGDRSVTFVLKRSQPAFLMLLASGMSPVYPFNPQTELAMNWHVEVIAAKLTAVRQGRIRRLIINLPPRHLKSLLASIAFPAWCLGHDPSAQILCISYAEALSNKLARYCRSIMTSRWYRHIFPTRLAAHRQAVQEFLTTREGYRLATSNGGVLTGADIILIDDPLKPEEALSDTQRQAANDWFSHTLYSRLNNKRTGAIVIIMQRRG